jgi:hypothetical protein
MFQGNDGATRSWIGLLEEVDLPEHTDNDTTDPPPGGASAVIAILAEEPRSRGAGALIAMRGEEAYAWAA